MYRVYRPLTLLLAATLLVSSAISSLPLITPVNNAFHNPTIATQSYSNLATMSDLEQALSNPKSINEIILQADAVLKKQDNVLERSIYSISQHGYLADCGNYTIYVASAASLLGYPPYTMIFRGHDKDSGEVVDHMVFIYQEKNGKWGMVGINPWSTRDPVYEDIESLAKSINENEDYLFTKYGLFRLSPKIIDPNNINQNLDEELKKEIKELKLQYWIR